MIFLPVENQGEEGADDALGQLAKEGAMPVEPPPVLTNRCLAQFPRDNIVAECMLIMAE